MDIVTCKQGFEQSLVDQVVKSLQQGKVIVTPTDTCYGFSCAIDSPQAVESLYQIKQMPRTKPISVLVSSVEMAKEYGLVGEKAEMVLDQYWPGPLTVILQRKSALPNWINIDLDSIGMRWPDHQFLNQVVELLGVPITTTSANLSGGVELYDVQGFGKGFEFLPDLVIDAGELPKNLPSTIVKFAEVEWTLIRQGELSVDLD